MADYKSLPLDKAKIDGSIRAFPGVKEVRGPIAGKGLDAYEVDVEGQEQCATLHIMFKADGLITLHHKLGKNQVLSEGLAQHVAEQCPLPKLYEPRPLSLKKISEDDWQFLQDSLTAEGFLLTKEAHDHAERFKVQGENHQDFVFIHRFKTGSFLMQGKARFAYAKVVECLNYSATEPQQRKELIDSQLNTLAIKDTDSTTLLRDLAQMLPRAFDKMPPALHGMLAPSLLVNTISIDLPDYAIFVMPALKCLEGGVKDIFYRKKFPPKVQRYQLGDHFSSDGKMMQATKSVIKCSNTCDAAERMYSVFGVHRNGLMHVNMLIAMSKIVPTQQDARNIVNNALRAIDDAYAMIP